MRVILFFNVTKNKNYLETIHSIVRMNYILKQIEKINMNLLGKVTFQNNFNQ